MNTELVSKIENKISTLEKQIDKRRLAHQYFLSKENDLSKKELREAYNNQVECNELIDELNTTRSELEEYKALCQDETKKAEKIALERNLSLIYANVESLDDEKLNDFDEKNAKSKGGVVKGFIYGLSLILALGGAHHLGKAIKDSSDKNLESSQIELTDESNSVMSETNQLEVLETPVQTIAPTGELGTFLDATNDEQVEARANYIYLNHIRPIIDELDRNGKNVKEYDIEITPATIANLIRVYNGELPIENGYPSYDENTINYYVTLANKMYATLPSDKRLDGVRFAPMAYLMEDGSQAQYLAQIYDEDYKRIAEARNTGDYDESVKAIQQLGYDLRDRVLIFGLQGEVTPMSVRENGNSAYTAAMGRYASYVLEWNLAKKKATCIPVCSNYKTGEIENWPITKIYETIQDGDYNNIVAKMTGSEKVNDPIGIILFEESDDILKEKYNSLEKGQSLTYKG